MLRFQTSKEALSWGIVVTVARIVQKLNLDGGQKVKGLERTASNQPITQSDPKRPSKSAEYVAIVHSFAEFKGQAMVAKQGKKPLKKNQRLLRDVNLRVP